MTSRLYHCAAPTAKPNYEARRYAVSSGALRAFYGARLLSNRRYVGAVKNLNLVAGRNKLGRGSALVLEITERSYVAFDVPVCGDVPIVSLTKQIIVVAGTIRTRHTRSLYGSREQRMHLCTCNEIQLVEAIAHMASWWPFFDPLTAHT